MQEENRISALADLILATMVEDVGLAPSTPHVVKSRSANPKVASVSISREDFFLSSPDMADLRRLAPIIGEL